MLLQCIPKKLGGNDIQKLSCMAYNPLCYTSTCPRVVMDDLMKMEPDSDPLAIQTSDNADTEEGKLLSEEGDLLDFHFVAIKTECMDHRYEVKSEMTYEEAAVSVDFPIVKTEAEEEQSDLDTVNEEPRVEGTAEDNEIFTECY
ncbi:uncharacterized protein [Periplaneta americana]|uniref:uncharacterized protein isoform X3 n=1 Tax=Periplaneta americana TaxID=6978 RepID=UPI0037E9530F